jgi:hypothetical protein
MSSINCFQTPAIRLLYTPRSILLHQVTVGFLLIVVIVLYTAGCFSSLAWGLCITVYIFEKIVKILIKQRNVKDDLLIFVWCNNCQIYKWQRMAERPSWIEACVEYRLFVTFRETSMNFVGLEWRETQKLPFCMETYITTMTESRKHRSLKYFVACVFDNTSNLL